MLFIYFFIEIDIDLLLRFALGIEAASFCEAIAEQKI
jgi:hypothetical protein